MNGLTLSVGETATFILKQNLTTGYGWEINESVANGVYSVSSQDKAGSNARGMVGVPGTKEITINGLM
jgi:predicted secreted protein